MEYVHGMYCSGAISAETPARSIAQYPIKLRHAWQVKHLQSIMLTEGFKRRLSCSVFYSVFVSLYVELPVVSCTAVMVRTLSAVSYRSKYCSSGGGANFVFMLFL